MNLEMMDYKYISDPEVKKQLEKNKKKSREDDSFSDENSKNDKEEKANILIKKKKDTFRKSRFDSLKP